MVCQLPYFDLMSHVNNFCDVLQIQRGQGILWTWHRGSFPLRPQHSALPSQQGRRLTRQHAVPHGLKTPAKSSFVHCSKDFYLNARPNTDELTVVQNLYIVFSAALSFLASHQVQVHKLSAQRVLTASG